jgi:hypothetical protein
MRVTKCPLETLKKIEISTKDAKDAKKSWGWGVSNNH